MLCEFVPVSEGEATCERCKRPLKFKGRPAKIVRKCERGGPQRKVPKLYEHPCTHRTPTDATFNCGCGIGLQTVFSCSHPKRVKELAVLRIGNAKFKPAGNQYAECSSCTLRPTPSPTAETAGRTSAP
jgi:hypothetical protein